MPDVPARCPDVAAVEVDGETVLWLFGRLHRLDPSASLVWRLVDGSRSADEIVMLVATAAEQEPQDVAEAVEGVLGQLRTLGVLVGGPAN